MQAARLTDTATGPGPGNIMGPGAPTVMIANMPAAVVGDNVLYTPPPPATPITAPISKGSATVFICKKPAARMGDIAGPGSILMGAPTVMIGG